LHLALENRSEKLLLLLLLLLLMQVQQVLLLLLQQELLVLAYQADESLRLLKEFAVHRRHQRWPNHGGQKRKHGWIKF
jgi:hypothetical protein